MQGSQLSHAPVPAAMPSPPWCIFTRSRAQTKFFSLYLLYKFTFWSQAWWCTEVTPASRRLRQEVLEFEGCLGYILRPHLNIKILSRPFTFLFPTTQTPRPIKVSSFFTFTKFQLGCKIFTENTWLEAHKKHSWKRELFGHEILF